MLNQQDRKRLLNEALAGTIPESCEWTCGQARASSGEFEYWIEIRSPTRPAVQHLTILLRHDGDIQVEYHVADKSGSPFELLLILEAGHDEETIKGASLFVADILAERLVLAYRKGLFKAGRQFLLPAQAQASRRHLKWTTSWLGTYDWQL
jgi:hypothetical protein